MYSLVIVLTVGLAAALWMDMKSEELTAKEEE